MKKMVVSIIGLFLMTTSAFANNMRDDHHYQKTVFTIKNNAAYPVLLTMDMVEGNWAAPIAIKEPILLNENQMYQNTITSIKKSGDVENFVSLDVTQLDNARENYLIFAESTSAKDQRVSADIFDGLGSIFVTSNTNYCNSSTADGYVYCELIIQNN